MLTNVNRSFINKLIFSWFTMKITVIIPHYDVDTRMDDLLKSFCLSNLFLYAPTVTETIVVDNGSKEPTKITGKHKVIRTDERLSFAAACNLGAKQAEGDILVFLNNDCQVLPGCIEKIVEAFDDAKVAICGAKLLSQDSTIQHEGIIFGKKRLPFHENMGAEDNNDFKGKYKEVKAVTGALIAIRADWFKKVGGFCEKFEGGNYEDVDICLQALADKKKVLVSMNSRAVHLGGASYGIHPDEHTDLLVRRNFEILTAKWSKRADSFFGITEDTPLLPREEEWKL